ncbi:hypothetical protein [Chitinophaga tropicalis]|uniref:Uncharacterized protein n=1 Tax=Chitinophaga tropicalis TaxID=2683588 RepID=A0A7K1U013_9BACT|nr:hypothetical protein [Chitinophaga tropicalis]MVT07692.1 hypothetical protein [Chitinophaga tropicalis]
MTQEENLQALFDDMKYSAGAETRHNAAITYHVKAGTEPFTLKEESSVDGSRLTTDLVFGYGHSEKDGYRFFYNGVDAALINIPIPAIQLGSLDVSALENMLRSRPTMDYEQPAAERERFYVEQKQSYDHIVNHKLQELAATDKELFHLLVAKYSPDLTFTQDEQDLTYQQQLRDQHTVRHFFTHHKNITLLEIPNLLEGRPVQKEYFNKNDEKYSTWIWLDLTKQKENGNYEWRYASFDLEAKLDEFNFPSLDDPKKHEKLLRNLKKGFQVELSAQHKDGNTQYVTISVNSEHGTIHIYADGKLQPHNNYRKTPRQRRSNSVVQLDGPADRSATRGGTPGNNVSSPEHPAQAEKQSGGNSPAGSAKADNNGQENTPHQQINTRMDAHKKPMTIRVPSGKRHGKGI